MAVSWKLHGRWIVPFVLMLIVTAFAVSSSRTDAGTPFVDDVMSSTSSRISYDVPASVVPRIGASDAVKAASAFAGRPITAHSVRVGLYNTLQKRNVPVWVIDADGLDLHLPGGDFFSGTPEPVTRAVILVSIDDGHIEGMYSGASSH